MIPAVGRPHTIIPVLVNQRRPRLINNRHLLLLLAVLRPGHVVDFIMGWRRLIQLGLWNIPLEQSRGLTFLTEFVHDEYGT
jgi:hypothetical protein